MDCPSLKGFCSTKIAVCVPIALSRSLGSAAQSDEKASEGTNRQSLGLAVVAQSVSKLIRIARFSLTDLYSPAGWNRPQFGLALHALETKMGIDFKRTWLTAALATLLTCSMGMPMPANGAQQVTSTGESRQNPAPWRPSFGSINKEAVPPTNGVANDGSGARASDGSGSRSASDGSGPRGSNANSNSSAQPFSLSPDSTQNSTRNGASPPLGSHTGAQSNEPGITRVTKTHDKLPNAAGQIWREYDISPYTSQITSSDEPQKAITEWILRETGTEMWFHQPLGILSADKNRLYVYHTPEIQSIVKGIVDRFVRTRGQVQNIDVNLVTVEKPNWRSQSYTMLQPIEVKSPGVEAWMISKENAAILLSQLSQRIDFKQHSGGRLTNHDGQSFSLEKTQPVQFVRKIRWAPSQVPNYQPLLTQLDEGYRLNISCLSALDNKTIEAVIKCDVDQVEKLSTVKVNLPGVNGAAQQMNLQIPQLVSWRLHERFRWPNDQVLLLSCGVVATPEPDSGGSGLRIPGLTAKTKRADALLFIEYRGPAQGASVPQTATNPLAPIRNRQ